MSGIKRLVLDVLIPLNTNSYELAVKISKLHGVEVADVEIVEMERNVETAKVTIEGENIKIEQIQEVLDKAGASLQSIDRITCGKRLVD